MPVRTNEFQQLIAAIQAHLDPGSTVSESAMLEDTLTGTKREVDIVVSGRVGGQTVNVSIECRDRSRGPDVTWVDEMHAKHSRLPTNVLVLVSHKAFTAEALRIAGKYRIRCLVLDDVDPSEQARLFPDVDSLWGKGWKISIDRVEVSVGPAPELDLAPERFRASPDTSLFNHDGTQLGSAAEIAGAVVRSQRVIDKMIEEAQPEHCYLELVWERPVVRGLRVSAQKLEPLVIRPIEQFRIVAKCVVTVDEFPLRHGVLEGLRVAWGAGNILGQPALIVASGTSGDNPKITLRVAGQGDQAG